MRSRAITVYIVAILAGTMALALPQKITSLPDRQMNDTTVAAKNDSIEATSVRPTTSSPTSSARTPAPPDDSTKSPESGNQTLPTPGPMMGPPPPHGGPMMGPAPGQGAGGGVMIGPPPLQGGSAVVG
jgi:hypothetical protein